MVNVDHQSDLVAHLIGYIIELKWITSKYEGKERLNGTCGCRVGLMAPCFSFRHLYVYWHSSLRLRLRSLAAALGDMAEDMLKDSHMVLIP